MDDLIKRLTKETGVNRKQAQGGLVALLRTAQQNMARQDFTQFVADIPGADIRHDVARPRRAGDDLPGGHQIELAHLLLKCHLR